MKIVGCDLHARQQTIAMVDTETGEFTEKTLSHEGNAVRAFYAALKGPVVVGIEATGSMQWFLELLEELGIQCRVGHPAKIRAKETRKQKHDRRDARLIWELLKSDHFTFGPLVDERYGDFAPTIMAFDLAFGYDCARCISTKAARTAVSDGSRRWGQVSLSSLLEFYACSEVFRSSRIGLDSQCFLGASSQEELCSSSLRWFLRHGSLGRRSYRLEKESWIDTHDECYGDFAPTIGIPAPRDFDIPCKT